MNELAERLYDQANLIDYSHDSRSIVRLLREAAETIRAQDHEITQLRLIVKMTTRDLGRGF